MATSGSTSFELTRDDIIKAALRKCGALAEGETPSTESITNGAQALNNIVVRFATLGMPLWKRTELPVTLVLGQRDYTIVNSLKAPQVILKDNTGGTQYELIPKSRYDYNRLPSNTSGIPVHFTFNPNLENGTVTIWPTPDASAVATKSLVVVYQKEFDGYTASGNTPDFPSYWNDATIYELAVNIAPEYGVPLLDRQALKQEAKAYLDQAMGYGDEEDSLYIQPERRMK
jgi:hypothetical protein